MYTFILNELLIFITCVLNIYVLYLHIMYYYYLYCICEISNFVSLIISHRSLIKLIIENCKRII